MYWLDRIENSRWMRWNVRLMAAAAVVAVVSRGVRWLAAVLF